MNCYIPVPENKTIDEYINILKSLGLSYESNTSHDCNVLWVFGDHFYCSNDTTTSLRNNNNFVVKIEDFIRFKEGDQKIDVDKLISCINLSKHMRDSDERSMRERNQLGELSEHVTSGYICIWMQTFMFNSDAKYAIYKARAGVDIIGDNLFFSLAQLAKALGVRHSELADIIRSNKRYEPRID